MYLNMCMHQCMDVMSSGLSIIHLPTCQSILFVCFCLLTCLFVLNLKQTQMLQRTSQMVVNLYVATFPLKVSFVEAWG